MITRTKFRLIILKFKPLSSTLSRNITRSTENAGVILQLKTEMSALLQKSKLLARRMKENRPSREALRLDVGLLARGREFADH